MTCGLLRTGNVSAQGDEYENRFESKDRNRTAGADWRIGSGAKRQRALSTSTRERTHRRQPPGSDQALPDHRSEIRLRPQTRREIAAPDRAGLREAWKHRSPQSL